MSKKNKSNNTEELITISKTDYDNYVSFANTGVESTEHTDDDEKLEEIKQNYDDDEAGSIPDPDNSRWELDSSQVVSEVTRALRRQYRNSRGQWVRPPNEAPMLNERGVYDLASCLSSYLTKDIALSNIEETDARKFTYIILRSIIKLVKYNHRKWELEKPYFDHVLRIIETKVFFHLMRPVGQGERKYRAKRISMHETYNHDEVKPEELGYGNSNFGSSNI